MPTVSVIMPAYNAEPFIPQALERLLNQTFRDVEVLVIDDGSQDQTAALVQAYGPPVDYIHQPHGGVSRARNAGLRRATGQYIAFHDADDVWEPTKLEKQVAVLESRPEIGLCFTSVLVVDRELSPMRVIHARDYADFCEALLLYPSVVTGSCSSAMVRRDVVGAVGGFDPALSIAADWDYWLRLSRLTDFLPIHEPLVKYRQWEGSMSQNLALLEQELLRVLKKFYAGHPPEKYRRLKSRCFSTQWISLSAAYYRADRVRQSLRCLGQAVCYYPPSLITPFRLIQMVAEAQAVPTSRIYTNMILRATKLSKTRSHGSKECPRDPLR
jgi:glycosyltransferase involved in cell wall biosynthesis